MTPRFIRLFSSRATQVPVAAISGVLAGVVVYSITQIKGRNLFILTGGISGVVAVFVIQVYRRAARLTEVKITVPQFSELTFLVNNDARQVAWKLFVETSTRAATQPLDQGSGILRETLTSLYGLFTVTRELLKESRPSVPVPGGQTVEQLAIAMLNRELRPFLSKWHPRLLSFERSGSGQMESDWAESGSFRDELNKLQENIRTYSLGFARLAGVRDAEEIIMQLG